MSCRCDLSAGVGGEGETRVRGGFGDIGIGSGENGYAFELYTQGGMGDGFLYL